MSAPVRPAAPPAPPPPARRWPLALAVVILGVNLRPAVASVGPVLEDIRTDLGLSAAAVAALTALPVLCFGAAAALAPPAARRLGPERTLVLTLAVTAGGLLLRLGPSVATLFVGTLLAGAGIAVGNVLLPALIKRDFADRTGLMMGIYTTTLSLSAAVAAAVTVPAVRLLGGGWRSGLGVWAVPALVALAVWLVLALRRPAVPAAVASGPAGSLLSDRRAWQVTAFMGLQSLGFYTMLAWLPSVYREVGLSAVTAGALLGLLATVGTPVGLVLPSLLVRRDDQRGWVACVTAVTGLGLLGLALAPAAAPALWAVLIGLGQGASFPLALTLVVLRSRDAVDAGRLSAMSQGIGYALAAVGPLAIGVLHDAAGGWRVPLLVLVGLLVPQLLAGLGAARPGFVGERAREPRRPRTGAG